MATEDVFKEAAERVKRLPSCSNDDQLMLYSYFKQANVGDCNTARPSGFLNMKEKAKWDAWKSREGTSKDDAMKAYIEMVDLLCGTSFMSRV